MASAIPRPSPAPGSGGGLPPQAGRSALPALDSHDADALALNNDHAAELSAQDPDGFARLVGAAYRAVWSPDRSGFLIAFDERADYASPNYRWFRARWPRFVYVDRVVVRAEARGRGVAGRLYADLLAAAASDGHDRIGCEVNAVPANPASDAFHARLGFRPLGTAAIGSKTVRYLGLGLGPAPFAVG